MGCAGWCLCFYHGFTWSLLIPVSGLASAQVSLIAMDLPGNHWDVSPPVTAIGPDPGKALLSPEPWDGGLEVCLEEW